MLVDIVNQLNREKYHPSVCITRSTSTLAGEIHPHIPLKILGRRWTLDPRGFSRLSAFSHAQKVDLYHAHGRSTASFLVLANWMGIIKKPIILHDHLGIETNTRVPLWIKVLAQASITHYIGVNDKLGCWAEKAGIEPGKISVIGNGLDFHRFERFQAHNLHRILNLSPSRKIGIMVGNIRPEKGLAELVDACNMIPHDQLPAIVVIGRDADPVYAARCRRRIESLGLGSSFFFSGYQEDSIAWIKGADFAVMPSLSESGPLVLIEYMACGLPFVAFNVGGVSAFVQPLLPESFATPGDSSHLADRLLELLNTSAKELDRRASVARKYARQHFDIRTKISAFTDLYDQVMRETA